MELSYEALCNEISRKADFQPLILTANQRQSRQLLKLLVAEIGVGKVVQRPKVLSLTTWFKELAKDICLSDAYVERFGDCALIDDFETSKIWSDLVKADPDATGLLNKQDFSRQLKSAYEICQDYRIKDQDLFSSTLDETRSFIDFKARYLRELKTLSCIDIYQFLNQLCSWPAKVVDRQIFLFGFSEVPPLALDALSFISSLDVTTLYLPPQNSEIKFFEAKSKTLEIDFAAQWAAQAISNNSECQGREDSYEIAVVVPDLSKNLNELERRFLKTIEPERYLARGTTVIPSEFDISAGRELAQHPIARTAVLIAKLVRSQLKKEDLTYLLRSPYWGSGFGAFKQRMLERINASHQETISIYQFLDPKDTYSSGSSASMQGDLFELAPQNENNSSSKSSENETAILLKLRAKKNKLESRSTFSHWSAILIELLKTAGFPGPEVLSSYEYQLVKRLFLAIEEIGKLDAVWSAPQTYSEFEQALNLKLKSTIFQAEVPRPKVRILGLMEAAGLRFEKCLVIGLTDTTLPQPAKPHPFLPIDIQKAYSTPKSTAERELSYGKAFLDTLIKNSESISLCFHTEDESGPNAVSPLLNSLLKENNHELLQVSTEESHIEQAISESLEFCDFEDQVLGQAPVIPQNTQIKGGAYHLDLHWINPLFAFFKFRLGIDKKESQPLGLSKKDRGTLIHSLLFDLYKSYDSQEKIEALFEDGQYPSLLKNIAEHTLSHSGNTGSRLYPASLEYELSNMCLLAEQVLRFDLNERANFKTHQLEASFELVMLDRYLRVRIDRIDQVDEGLILFDYKTGKTSLAGLTKENLSDYQLPLYCLALDEIPVGLGYFTARSNDINIKGLSASDLRVTGLSLPHKIPRSQLDESWDALILDWRKSIQDRVNEIINGDVNFNARVKSKQGFYEHYLSAIRPEELEADNGH